MTLQPADTAFNEISLQPGQGTHFNFTVKAPDIKGKYELIFSIRTQPFTGSKNSRIIKFVTE
jgi:hypothetical protein